MANMKQPAENRTAIVTGASSGIGRAICEQLLQDHWQVVGLARDFAKSHQHQHDSFTAHSLDLGQLDDLPRQLDEIAGEHEQIDALICCAGMGRFGHLEQFSYTQIRELVDLNFTSQAFVVRAFLPRMKRRGAGDIVIIGSEAALRGSRKGTLYCASKFALRGFVQALREESSAASIRVCLINPGMVQTAFFDELDFTPGRDSDQHLLPGDVAAAVSQVLHARQGTVIDEINLSPQKHVIEFRPHAKKEGDADGNRQ